MSAESSGWVYDEPTAFAARLGTEHQSRSSLVEVCFHHGCGPRTKTLQIVVSSDSSLVSPSDANPCARDRTTGFVVTGTSDSTGTDSGWKDGDRGDSAVVVAD